MGCRLWGHTESDTTEATAAAAGTSIRYLSGRYWVGWGSSGKTLGNTHPGSRYWVGPSWKIARQFNFHTAERHWEGDRLS